MSFKFSKTSLRRMQGVDVRLCSIIRNALDHSPIDFGIPKYGGLRSESEQAALYKQGLSQLDGVNKKSKHQEGKAIDIFAYVNGEASWDERHYRLLAGVILSTADRFGCDLRWGGDWDGDNDYSDQTFNDLVHFELK